MIKGVSIRILIKIDGFLRIGGVEINEAQQNSTICLEYYTLVL